jgi:hypothetical protein
MERHRDQPRLPRIHIPKWTRTAEEVTKTIREKWDLTTIVIDFLPVQQDFPPGLVMEVCMHDRPSIPSELIPVTLHEIGTPQLAQQEKAAVADILAGRSGSRGPFSGLRWMEEAKAWIQGSVADHDVEFNCEILQLNAGASN